MATYLQLYLDTDFIIPIGVGESGDFQKYIDNHASRRLWLYFSKQTNMFETSEAYKANFEAGRDGFYGDFWKHIEKGDKVEGETFPYIELLDLSRITTKLREWAGVSLGTDTPELVLNFSTVIPVKARLVFSKYMEDKLGKIRSYSVEINDLLSSKIAYDNQTLVPAFGDQLMIIQSAGRDILLSVQTWCGDQFMQGEEPLRLSKKGNEYLKYELAKIVVDHFEQVYHMLLPAQKEREYQYQMQFAEEWLKERTGDDSFWVDYFHYSTNISKTYPSVEIDGRQLNLIEKAAIRNTINDINRYYRENVVNRHLHTILLGDVFKEEVFLKDCVSVTSSDGKYTFFNDNAIQEAMGRYYVCYSTFTESLANLERTFMDKANERSRIRAYVHNAEILGSLRDSIALVITKTQDAINDVEKRNADLKASWESQMKKSAFSDAAETVSQMSTSDGLLVGKAESIDILKKIERSNSLLIELKQLRDVEPIIDTIRDGEKKLRNLIEKVDILGNLQRTLNDTIQKYSDSYDKYKELRKKFDIESTLSVRKKILDEMKQLTMEEMPVLDVAPIKGKITIKSQSVGGLLGFGSKKSISLTLQLDNPLPCRGVLLVSPKLVSSIPVDRMGVYTIDVEKGSEGVVIETTLEIGTLGLSNNAKTFFVKFWPHEDEHVPINMFEIKGGGTVTI